ARNYERLLATTSLWLPHARPQVEHVYHLYVVRSGHREQLRSYLRENAINTAIHYPVPVHLQPAYQSRVKIGGGELHETEQACREILSLPMYPQMTEEQVQYVGECIAHWSHMLGSSP